MYKYKLTKYKHKNTKISSIGGAIDAIHTINYFIVWIGDTMASKCTFKQSNNVNFNETNYSQHVFHCTDNIVHNIKIMLESPVTIVNCHVFCDSDNFFNNLANIEGVDFDDIYTLFLK